MRFGRVNIGLSELYGTGRIPFQLSGTARRPHGYAGLSAHSAPGRLLRRHGGAHRQAGYAPAPARPHQFCPPRQPPDGKMRRGSRHGPQTVRRSFWRRQAVGTGMTAENGRGRICLEDKRHPFVFRCGRAAVLSCPDGLPRISPPKRRMAGDGALRKKQAYMIVQSQTQ